MAYCDVSLIRSVSGLTQSDISDGDLEDLRDQVATPELNADVNFTVDDERVRHISEEKENDVDGSNTVFYARELHQNPFHLGDRNDDGDVNDSDAEFYYIDHDDTRVDNLQVTLLDASIGKFEVKDSNGNALKETDVDKLYMSYHVCPKDAKTPDRLIKRACAQLTAAYGFTNIEATKLKSFSVGNVSIRKQSEGFSTMKDQYKDTVDDIMQTLSVQTAQNENVFENLDVFGTNSEYWGKDDYDRWY